MMTVLTFLTGCVTIPLTRKSSGSSAKKAEQGTYSQVPASMRGDVTEAEYDLKLAQKNVKLAEEKVKLAELEKQRANLGGKYAEYHKKLADTLHKKAELIVEAKKMKAVDNAGLGDKADNMRRLTDYKNSELKIVIEENDIKLEIDTIALQLKELDKKIQAQAEVVAKAGGYSKRSQTARQKTKKVRKKRKK